MITITIMTITTTSHIHNNSNNNNRSNIGKSDASKPTMGGGQPDDGEQDDDGGGGAGNDKHKAPTRLLEVDTQRIKMGQGGRRKVWSRRGLQVQNILAWSKQN